VRGVYDNGGHIYGGDIVGDIFAYVVFAERHKSEKGVLVDAENHRLLLQHLKVAVRSGFPGRRTVIQCLLGCGCALGKGRDKFMVALLQKCINLRLIIRIA
jgi:hypothetical protein